MDAHERRAGLLEMESHYDFRVAVLAEIDFAIDAAIAAATVRIVNGCNDHFQAVLVAVEYSERRQLNAIQTNTVMTQASMTASSENTEAIKALAEILNRHMDSLTITSGIESTGKKGYGMARSLGTKLGEFGAWAKKSFVGLAVVGLALAVFTGHVTRDDIAKFFAKILGG